MIGLVTPFITNNYGTKLQALAMQTVLDINGFENEIIRYSFGERNYNLKKIFLANRKEFKSKQQKRMAALEQNPNIQHGYQIRNTKFREFTEKQYRFSRPVSTLKQAADQAKQYTAVICGSDQIWLPSHVLEKYYMLEFVPKGVRRIAYAPSFGVGEIPWYVKREYQTALKQFDTITVREKRGAELVAELTGNPCPVVADPTLLLKKEQWENRLKIDSSIFHEKYAFAYFIGSNKIHRQIAKKYADAYGLKLIILPNIGEIVPYDEEYSNIAPYDIAPNDFVNLIRNSECVFTDSFHGSVFSLIFQRDLYVFERFANTSKVSTNSRIHSLLQVAGIQDRMISEHNNWSLDVKNIDYCDVDKRLKELRTVSANILFGALKR